MMLALHTNVQISRINNVSCRLRMVVHQDDVEDGSSDPQTTVRRLTSYHCCRQRNYLFVIHDHLYRRPDRKQRLGELRRLWMGQEELQTQEQRWRPRLSGLEWFRR